jgi:AraC-like DNA-binding protein
MLHLLWGFIIMLKEVISNLKNTGLKYRLGFFELTYKANSPEEIVKSSGKWSFIKHQKANHFVTSNTFFFNVQLSYYKITEGLWVLYTETVFKNNMKLISQYDGSDVNSDDYYMLILSVNSDSIDLKIFGQKEKYSATKYHWGLYKPKNTIATYNYKNSEAKYITICINKDWLAKNLAHIVGNDKSKLNEFLLSDKKFIVCAELNEQLKRYFDEIHDQFINFRQTKLMNLIQLQGQIFALIGGFIERIETEDLYLKKRTITDDQRNLILKIERYLQSNLNHKFEGIEFLTKKFNISESKLKYDFKQIFGVSVYQYFNKHQMLLAKQLLQKKNTQVKEIAYNFGYESPSKFTEAFKKHVGKLPSEVG